MAAGYTLVIAAILIATESGNMFAILLILFFPGYALAAVLFPRANEIDWTERLALSVGLSIAIVPLLAFSLTISPWGVRLVPTVLIITSFTILTAMAAHLRRIRLPTAERLGVTLEFALDELNEGTRVDKALTTAVIASVLVAAAALFYLVLAPQPTERFTEFFILGPGGKASGYPTALNISQTGSVTIGIANHEGAMVDYTIHVQLIALRTAFNASSGRNESIELNRTTLSWINITRADGENWTQSYIFSISATGSWKLRFLLYENAVLTNLELHLIIRVS